MAHNLPLQTATFVGRSQQIAEIKGLLSDVHLLTLTGPGGVGKTRLALQVADSVVERFADGVWLVDLAAVSEGRLVPQAVALSVGVHDLPDEPLAETLVNAVQAKNLLLVLDNCEHVLGACQSLIHLLLHSCASARVLATSRQALAIPGEIAWRVPSLDLPERNGACSAERMGGDEAVELFCDRARAALRTFALADQDGPAIADICWRLDGIPLAIELAAARVTMLSVQEIAARLEDIFRLLNTGSRMAPNRQQTLRATIDWSFELLSESEQRMLEWLSTFTGGWSLEAAEAVCSEGDIRPRDVLDLLSQLVDRSLVLVEPAANGAVRYRLSETLRQYGQERLRERGGMEPAARRHAGFFLQLAERAEPDLLKAGQQVWLEQLDQEHENLRTVARYFVDQRDLDGAERLVGALRNFWFYRGYLREGRAWLTEILALGRDSGVAGERLDAPPHAMLLARHARVMHAEAVLAFAQGDYQAAQSAGEREFELWQTTGNDAATANALLGLGFVAKCRGDYRLASDRLEESVRVSRAAGDKIILALSLASLADVAYDEADYALARTTAEKALGIAKQIELPTAIAESLLTLGKVSCEQADYARAQPLLEASLRIARELGRKSAIAVALASLAQVASAQRNGPLAGALLQESLRVAREIGDRLGIARALEGLTHVAADAVGPRPAAILAGAAHSLRASIGAPLSAYGRAALDRRLESIDARLGASAKAAAWTEGQTLPVDRAIAVALDLRITSSASPVSNQPDALTPREREVAALAARGWKNSEIAQQLVITEKTAKNHVAHILAKLGLRSRARLAALARDESWDRPD